MDLVQVVIDLTKAFDTVSRVFLWKILGKLEYLDRFISITKSFHDGVEVNVGNGMAGPIPVENGVKQLSFLCILLPLLLILLQRLTLWEYMLGVYGIPIEKVTECIVTAIKEYLDTHTNSKIKHICLIDVQKEVIRAFKCRLETVFGISKSRETTSFNASLLGPQQKAAPMTPRTNVASGENDGIKIQLLIDSISNASVDVIVNSTNERLQLNKGSISNSILNAAGSQIQDECNQRYPQGISTSTIAITKGYNLKCENVFHLVLPPWDEYSSDLEFEEYLQNKDGNEGMMNKQEKEGFHSKDAENVVQRRSIIRRHRLQSVKLDVQPFWKPSEENTISRHQVHDYLLPSKFHLTFLKKHRTEVNDQLKTLAEVLWEDSKINTLKLKYSEEYSEQIEKCLKDLLNSIIVEIIDVPGEIFEDIVRTFKSEDDKKYFYFDFRYHKAHILGFDKNNVIKMKKRLLDNLRMECEDELNIHERRILSGLEFFEDAERQFEGLKVTAESNKVIFEGQYSEVTNCQKNMYEILRSIVKSELPLPLNTGMIINKKSVKEYLDEKLRNKKCIGSWETGDGDSVLLYASDKTHLSLLEEIMKETFVANTLDFVDKIKDTPNHGKWLTLVKSLKEEFPDFCFIGENSIVAVDAVVNVIKSKIDDFEQSLIYESYISMPLEHFLFLKEFIEQEINDFGEKNKIKNACLKDNKLHLEGTQEQIRKMETFIENLRKDISSKEENFEMFGFQEFLESEEGNNFLCEMQKKSESIISLNLALGSEAEEIVNVNYKNCEIVLKEGDITTLDTDAIVNAANGRLEHRGGVAAAIVQKG
ncbi:Hypothetical predicted protein [Octopus vulgaris]|uniref:Macro domain-containing protein n=1 Tax=Octopus vulgaris TaxID=6645 RepID=A0AA36AET3_OCTVU|nr:Hypothetical predicted protein [Octopus vulgaris]